MSYIPGSVLETHAAFRKIFEVMSTFTHEDMVERGIDENRMWEAYIQAVDKAYSDFYDFDLRQDEMKLDMLYDEHEEELYSPSTHDDLVY